MVAGTGLEPIIEDYESSVIPFHQPAIIMERDIGIEPITKGWKPLVLPLN